MKTGGRFVTASIVAALFILSPFIYVVSKVLDCCSLSGHAWATDGKVYMRPVRQCTKCGQVQVKLPKLEKVSKGEWVNHHVPLDWRNL